MKRQHGDGPNYKSINDLKHFQIKHRGKNRNTNLKSHTADVINTIEALEDNQMEDFLDEVSENDTADVINTIEALEDKHMEDFLDEVSENDEVLEDTHISSTDEVPDNTHISSTVLAELNEVLTNKKNKTKIILTTGT